MPIIGNRYYANPAYGRRMEMAREEEAEGGEASGAGRVHRIHIARDEDGIKVRVLRHSPGSEEQEREPSGRFTTHRFEHDDHEGVAEFVKSALAKR